MEGTYYLHFKGSLSDNSRAFLPTYSGVYLVYRGIWSEKDKLFYCHEIIYIGKADNIRQRHFSHERRNDFFAVCRPGEIIFYSYAEVSMNALDRVEAALIYHTKPVLNNNRKDEFPFEQTHVISDGACALLDSDIVAE